MSSLDLRTTRVDAGIVDVVVITPHPAKPGARVVGAPWRILTLRRAAGVRCTGAWELVHGSIEPGERPADAARREVAEETGFAVERLYSITVNPFYLPTADTVQFAIVFAAVVAGGEPTLGAEHDAHAWHTPAGATRVLAWPREHQAVRYTMHLLRSGNAGAAEQVLHIAPR